VASLATYVADLHEHVV